MSKHELVLKANTKETEQSIETTVIGVSSPARATVTDADLQTATSTAATKTPVEKTVLGLTSPSSNNVPDSDLLLATATASGVPTTPVSSPPKVLQITTSIVPEATIPKPTPTQYVEKSGLGVSSTPSANVTHANIGTKVSISDGTAKTIQVTDVTSITAPLSSPPKGLELATLTAPQLLITHPAQTQSVLGASSSNSVNVTDTDIVTKASSPDGSAKMERLTMFWLLLYQLHQNLKQNFRPKWHRRT
jgi:hypothetical protein